MKSCRSIDCLRGFWLGIGVNLQAVLDHLPGDPRHLRWLPCEYVGVCLEESDEREFLFLVQISGNASGLGGVRSEPDGFDGDTIRFGWLYLWCLEGHLGAGGRGVPSSVVWASSLYRHGVQLFYGC
jgi:hypothetical protein